MNEQSITRRSLVAGAAAATAAGVAVAAKPALADVAPRYEASVPEAWDRSCEILVIGTGIGGAAAAVEAYDEGADVLVVTAAPSITENSCTRSGGWICGVGTYLQEDEGIEDSVDLFVKDVMRCGGEMGDPDIIRAVAEISGESIDWLVDRVGVDISQRVYDAAVEAGSNSHSVPRDYCSNPLGQGGYGWMKGLEDCIFDECGIEVVFDTCATRLFRNEDGRVVGASFAPKDGSASFTVEATKGIIFNPGGLGGGFDAWARYTPIMREIGEKCRMMVSVAPVDVKGDGFQMLEDIDAYMYPAPPNYGGGALYLGDDEPGNGNMIQWVWANEGVIEVNLNGERYMNETLFDEFYGDNKKFIDQPEMVTLVVFDDETYHKTGCQTYGAPLFDKAMEKGVSTVHKADTLEELAEQMGVPVDTFMATVEDFNSYCGTEGPDQFGRTSFEQKIETAPFYAMELNISVATSKGGCKIDPQGRIIDVKGQVIPGIIGVGEIAAFQFSGDARIHIVGGCNCPSLCFGRIGAHTLLEDAE